MIYMNKWLRSSAGLLMAFLCVIISNAGVCAHAQTSGGFSIQAVIPENQIDKKQTYFDLRMKPGDEQTVEVIINNARDEELIARVRLNAASTGRNGLIVYTAPDVRSESMKVAITDVAALQTESVTIPAHSSKAVAINIKMPEEPVAGVVLGGIAVTGEAAGYDTQTEQGVSLENKITYVIALKLTESDTVDAADFDLANIKPELVNFKTAVVATLENKSARIVKGMAVNAQIFRKGADTALHELERDAAEMAPLSTGDFVIDWENQPFERGTYRLKMTAAYEGEIWEWDEEFTIGTEAGNLNSGAVGIPNDYTWLYVSFGIVILAVVWFVAYYSGRRRKINEYPQGNR